MDEFVPLGSAPLLPPEIIKIELDLAKKYLEMCEKRANDVYTYAPGGSAYLQLCESTRVGKVSDA